MRSRIPGIGLVCMMPAVLAFPAGIAAPPTVIPNPVPYLNPIVPAATTPAGAGYTLAVTGTALRGRLGSHMERRNARRNAFVNSCKLTAIVPAARTASPGTATIAVVSPLPGGGTSNAQYFAVENAVSA